MHERQFSLAARPEPVIILGLLLRPYSIGHELCLIRASNPLAESETGTPVDLAEAVWICHQTWAENRDELFDRLFFLKRWIWRARLKRKRIHFERELKAFADYRESGSLEFPLSGIPDPDGSGYPVRPRGAPFLACLHLFERARGLSVDQSWDYPLGLAKCEWQAHWEMEGALRVYNAEDAAHEMARQQWESLRKAVNGRG